MTKFQSVLEKEFTLDPKYEYYKKVIFMGGKKLELTLEKTGEDGRYLLGLFKGDDNLLSSKMPIGDPELIFNSN
jgi:hypothetical protein